MRRSVVTLTLLVTLTWSVGLTAQPQMPPVPDSIVDTHNAPWSGQRAQTIPKGRFEVGVFSPLRYGVTSDVELSTHPLWMFVIPNVSAKVQWETVGSWRLSTKHSLHVPTFLLRLLAREGTGGVLPVTSDIPFMVGLDNGIVATTQVPNAPHRVTISTGFSVAPRFGDADFPTIDLAIVYPRMMAYHTALATYGSIAAEGALGGPFHYHLKGKGFFATGLGGAFSLEQTIRLSWRPSRAFQLSAGAISTFSALPFGQDARILPLIDAHFSF